MRGGILILSLLIVVAIILFVSFSGPHGGYVPTVIQANNNARHDVEIIAGQDDNGMRNSDSVTLDEDNGSGTKLKGLIVSKLIPNGPMARYYRLQVGDEITEIGPQRVRDQIDTELAKDWVYEAPQHQWDLVVVRGGQQFTLTPERLITGPNGGGNTAPTATPNGPTPDNSLQNQLNQLGNAANVPTH